MLDSYLKLMLVTDRQSRDIADYLLFVEQCILGGVTCIQLREKTSPPLVKKLFAQRLKALLDHYAIPLIINDDVALALEIDAFGVHVGQSDCTPTDTRAQLGAKKIIGLSIESKGQLQNSFDCPIDYLGASAVFPTDHKNNIQTIWQLSGLQFLRTHARHPIVGIGGIDLTNVAQVIAAGATGVAIIGALHQAVNPQRTAFNLRNIIEGAGL